MRRPTCMLALLCMLPFAAPLAAPLAAQGTAQGATQGAAQAGAKADTGAHAPRFRSAALNAFEARRLAGGDGRFVSDSDFIKDENAMLSSVLVRRLHLIKVNGEGSAVYLASGRSMGNDGGPTFQSKRGANVWCFVSVYLDGARLFQGPDSPSNPPYDMSTMSPRDLSGAEYYSPGASMPPEFNATGSSCGVLLLWSRDR